MANNISTYLELQRLLANKGRQCRDCVHKRESNRTTREDERREKLQVSNRRRLTNVAA